MPGAAPEVEGEGTHPTRPDAKLRIASLNSPSSTLPRRLERFVHDLHNGFHVLPPWFARVEIADAFNTPAEEGHIVFGNIDAQRIRRAFGIDQSLLQGDLSFARQQPIDENFGGIWMRRLVDQGNRAELLHQAAAFFECLWPERIDRQSLLLQNVRVAEKANGIFPHREPIGALPVVAKELDIHLAEQFANK